MSQMIKEITLKSSDGDEFKVEKSIAMQSQKLCRMIEEDCVKDSIPLKTVNSKILLKVIEYCEKHADATSTEKDKAEEGSATAKVEMKIWDDKFVKVDQATLHGLIKAAQFLEIKGLYNLMASKDPNPNPNPDHEDDPQMEQEEDQPDWAGLDRDILKDIFEMVGMIDVIERVGHVCCAWRSVAKEDLALWKRIDLSSYVSADFKGLEFDAHAMVKIAIDRSQGMLQEFWVDYICDDDLLVYLCDRASELKSLRLLSCDLVLYEIFIKNIVKLPLLEELQISYRGWDLPNDFGRMLPNLKHFKLDEETYEREASMVANATFEREALMIANTMQQLRSLRLTGNRLTNVGLKAILEKCTRLETLDIRTCHYVNIDADMQSRCRRLKTFRPPNGSLDDLDVAPHHVEPPTPPLEDDSDDNVEDEVVGEDEDDDPIDQVLMYWADPGTDSDSGSDVEH